MNKITLEQVREDCYVLDTVNFEIPENVELLSHLRFTSVSGINTTIIEPNVFVKLFRRFPMLFTLLWAIQIFSRIGPRAVFIADGSGGALWLFIGLLNRMPFFRKRSLLCYDLFVEYLLGTEKRLRFFPFLKFKTKWKEVIAKNAILGYDLIVQWSKKQVETHASYYHIPKEKFIFLPFKANHSKHSMYDIPMDNFVFSGGNSKRDYKTLVDAVRGTGIPVIISATSPKVRQQIDAIPNVIVLGAPEPAFAQLQAACRFSVVSTINDGTKGAGETNMCNAMWHGKPVIAADDKSATDYIIEGETGFIVPCGDTELLRKRILELWNNPERCKEMGNNAHAHVVKCFTHFQLIQRLLRLALVLGQERQKR